MTVRVTSLKGAEAGLYYIDPDGVGRYYLDPSEPAGQWHGALAVELGLTDEVDPDVFLALMAGHDPATGQPLGRRYGEQSVRGYDVTFSAPKSVSVLWAVGDHRVRSSVLAAHDTTVQAVLGFIEDQAHTRLTVNGKVVVVDASGLAVARFRQHTSRTLDPQLHTHGIVIAKVQGPNGAWFALDGRMVKCDQQTLSALYQAGLRAELTRRLGVAWGPVESGIAETVGIPDDVRSLFSQRTEQVDARVDTKLERFRETMGREPTWKEQWRLEREAVVDSRPSKTHPKSAAELHAGWRAELAAAGVEPARLVADVVGRQVATRDLGVVDARAMAGTALHELIESRSSWRRNDLIRELGRATPTTVTTSAGQLLGSLERFSDQLLGGMIELAPTPPAGVPRRRDGRPITESTLDRLYTVPAILAEEEYLVSWAADRWAALHSASAAVDSDGLDRAQAVAARAVAGTAPLVDVVGPAGVGKTTMLRTAVRALQAHRRPVFGCAPSATAAAVLAQETKMPADTLDKLLYEHGTGHPDRQFQLPADTTVIVDEAGMVATPKLAALARLADRHHWRVILVGDPRQLSPVGRGGMFAHLTATGPVIELDRVHRFTHSWERAASLQLRRGDPDGIAAYADHGRIHDTLTGGDARRHALAAWTDATVAGHKVALLAATHASVDWLNHAAQHHRIAAGELDPRRCVTTGAGQRLHEGDRVVTRRNDRQLRTDRETMVKNRAVWIVTALHPNGSITAHGADGAIVLPAVYVRDYVELGYAETVHAAQGRTVDTSILVVDGPIDGRAVYVGLTRGRDANHAYVRATEQRTGVEILGDALMQDWTDTPAITTRADLAHRLGRTDPRLVGRGDLGRITDLILPPDRLRHLVAERNQLRHLGVDSHLHRHEQLHDEQNIDKQALAAGHRQRHKALRTLNEAREQRQQLGPFQRGERRQLDQQITGAENELRRIGAKLENIRQQIDRRRPEFDAETRWLRDHHTDVDRYHHTNKRLQQDVTARAQAIAHRTPAHVVRLVGPRPKASGNAQQAWDHAAGLIEQYRVTGSASQDLTRDAAEVRVACRAAQQLNPAFAPKRVSRTAALDRNLGRSGPTLGL